MDALEYMSRSAAQKVADRLHEIGAAIAERRQLEAAGQVLLRPLPSRRPQMMVKCSYSEPARGYALTLFCGCGIDPTSFDVVEVFVRPGHGHDANQQEHRDGLMERTLDDAGRFVSFLLRVGFTPAGLRDKLGSTGTDDIGAPHVILPDGLSLPVSSPLGAIVEACVWAQTEIRKAAIAPVPDADPTHQIVAGQCTRCHATQSMLRQLCPLHPDVRPRLEALHAAEATS